MEPSKPPAPDARELPRHPVRVVSQRTGLSPEVLRVWERRYGVVSPGRSDGGQRLYSDRDVERLGLLREAIAGGRSIGQLASLEDAAIRELIALDLVPIRETGPADEATARALLAEATRAVRDLAPEELDAVLGRATFTLGGERMLSQVLAPLLTGVGDGWHSGELTVAHEHAASQIVRRLLDRLIASFGTSPDAPLIGIATPQGERHEFGMMLVAATALSAGWRVLHIGADLPAADIAYAAMVGRVRALALSVVFVDDETRVIEEVRAIRDALPAGIALIVGGAGVEPLAEELERMDLAMLDQLADLIPALERLQQPGEREASTR